MNELLLEEAQYSDNMLDQILFDNDRTLMPLPDFEDEPHLLISKVRKHYMEYIIRLLSDNYENNQKLDNKNIYLPSAIWRCAKNIEMSAAKTCMVVQLYRKNITAVIKELKQDTKEGKLYKKLYDFVTRPPENEKKVQTSLSKSSNCTCQCICNQRKKRRKESDTSKQCRIDYVTSTTSNINMEDNKFSSEHLNTTDSDKNFTQNVESSMRMSVEPHESDELMLQLDKLFQSDCNDDDLFEGLLCNVPNTPMGEDNTKRLQNENYEIVNQDLDTANATINTELTQQKSLEEKLASIAGQLVHNTDVSFKKPVIQKNRRSGSGKWLCEEYFLKLHLFEILDQLRDCNRAKLARIKETLSDLFGNDSDDEGVISPLEETQEFITSCKERIAPWVVKIMTPYYIKGRIKGKALFKSVAKHLIRLIYQCSKYPNENEVKSFVKDFLESHKIIRCEADFKHFQINNI